MGAVCVPGFKETHQRCALAEVRAHVGELAEYSAELSHLSFVMIFHEAVPQGPSGNCFDTEDARELLIFVGHPREELSENFRFPSLQGFDPLRRYQTPNHR